MRIVDVCEFYAERGGGVKTYAHAKLRAGARAGHEVVILAPGKRDERRALEGGELVTIKSPVLPVDTRYHVFHSQRAIHRALDSLSPDVVEASSPYVGGWAVASYQGARVKSLIFHQDPIAVYPHTLLDRFVSRASIDRALSPVWSYLRRLSEGHDVTVTSGQWLADRLRSFGVHAPHAVPFGIDHTFFDPSRADPAVKRMWIERCKAKPESDLIVSVGRHHPEKRLHVVIDAFARARRERPMAMVLLGDGPMRPLVDYWAKRVPDLHVAGFTDDRALLASTLASADAVVHASAAETYGLSIAEAICAGAPVVVPDVGGAVELCGPSYSEAYATGDAQSCAEALLRLLARDRASMRNACQREGRARIVSVDQHFVELFALYSKLLAERESAQSVRSA